MPVWFQHSAVAWPLPALKKMEKAKERGKGMKTDIASEKREAAKVLRPIGRSNAKKGT